MNALHTGHQFTLTLQYVTILLFFVPLEFFPFKLVKEYVLLLLSFAVYAFFYLNIKLLVKIVWNESRKS